MPRLIHCPFHDDSTPSLAIYETHAYCFGGCGRIDLAALEPGLLERSREQGKLGQPADQRWQRLFHLWHWNLLEGPMQFRQLVLAKRGITRGMLQRYRVGHTGQWFVIPVWDGRRVTGVRFRRDDLFLGEEAPKYRNPRGQGCLLFRPSPGRGPVVICEGELDAMLLVELGCDALTPTAGAKATGDVLRVLPRYCEVYVATDQDEAGEQAWELLRQKLGQRARRWRWRQGKDVSEALLLLPREQWHQWVRERIRDASSRVDNRGSVYPIYASEGASS